MNFETLQKLDKLQQRIEDREFERDLLKTEEWEKYDVMVSSKRDEHNRRWTLLPAESLEFHITEAKRRIVITRYARELSWLFQELETIHPDEVERLSAHDFYAHLADAATLYIDENKGGLACSRLLETVMDEVRRVYR